MTNHKKLKSFFVAVLLIAFGFSLILGSVAYANNSTRGKTIATVTKIEKSKELVKNGNEELYTDVFTQYVTYEVDGVKYENVKYGECNKLVSVGDQMRIGYEVNQPDTPVYVENNSITAVRVCGWIITFFGFIATIDCFIGKNEVFC